MANNKTGAPLTPAALHILLALAAAERHGYGIMKQVKANSQGKVKVGPGTLYGSLNRMMAAGLIRKRDKRVDPEMGEERRVYYEITSLGQKALAAELQSYDEVVAVAGKGARCQKRSPMASERAIRRYRRWYVKLLHLYLQPYVKRFAEGMAQTFADLLRERGGEGRSLLRYALWLAAETSVGVMRENVMFALTRHRNFVHLALGTALVLVWINLAVGIIGSEDNPANLMYLGVLAVGVVGAMHGRFQPQGMARALYATALAQALVAMIALAAGWGFGVPLILNGIFVALWVGSALLTRADRRQSRVPEALTQRPVASYVAAHGPVADP